MYKIVENLETQDLEGRISPVIHFDQYVPKMGNEDEVIVSSFRVFGKHPAIDLENFIEKGYGWVLDAETSPGELSEGDYLVFVEAKRRTYFVGEFMSLLEDLKNICDVKEWQMVYYSTQLDERHVKPEPVTEQSLNTIPLSPRAYRERKASNNVLESMLNIARVPRKQGDIDGFKPFKRRFRD